MSELGRHTIHRDHIHHGWNNAFTPCLKIAPGETVQFETVDASSGQLSRTSTAVDVAKLDLARVNPVTGPVWIDGAAPGDALKITVLSFRRSGWGWTGNIPGFGLLTDQFPNAHLHHWNYDPSLAPAMYGPGGRVPLRPLTGTIGVAPAAPGLHSIIPPRNVGGNMDARDIGEGAELYLPVEVDGAIFSVGDTHAQGDGEVCGTAIKLSKLSGANFDREYMKNMVSDHKKDISDFKSEARKAKDPDVKQFAASTEPTLEEHLKLAQSAEKVANSEPRNTTQTSSRTTTNKTGT